MELKSGDDDQACNAPKSRCPGCGVPVAWLSNCGRYACVSIHGFPIVLDPMHRSRRDAAAGDQVRKVNGDE